MGDLGAFQLGNYSVHSKSCDVDFLCNIYLLCNVEISNKQGWPEPYIHGVYTVILAGKSPNRRSYGANTRFWPTLVISHAL